MSLEPNLPNSVIENTPNLFKTRTPLITSRFWKAGRFLLLRILRTDSHTSILTSLRPCRPSFQSPTLTSIIWSWLVAGGTLGVFLKLSAIFTSTLRDDPGEWDLEAKKDLNLPDPLPRGEREGGNPALRLISWSVLNIISWSTLKIISWSAFKLSSWSTFKLLSCRLLVFKLYRIHWPFKASNCSGRPQRRKMTIKRRDTGSLAWTCPWPYSTWRTGLNAPVT